MLTRKVTSVPFLWVFFVSAYYVIFTGVFGGVVSYILVIAIKKRHIFLMTVVKKVTTFVKKRHEINFIFFIK